MAQVLVVVVVLQLLVWVELLSLLLPVAVVLVVVIPHQLPEAEAVVPQVSTEQDLYILGLAVLEQLLVLVEQVVRLGVEELGEQPDLLDKEVTEHFLQVHLAAAAVAEFLAAAAAEVIFAVLEQTVVVLEEADQV